MSSLNVGNSGKKIIDTLKHGNLLISLKILILEFTGYRFHRKLFKKSAIMHFTYAEKL